MYKHTPTASTKKFDVAQDDFIKKRCILDYSYSNVSEFVYILNNKQNHVSYVNTL